ncbi:MAG: hypothetical protein NXI25_24735 [bacterium]|nr:hypothetical protein [bacterium]
MILGWSCEKEALPDISAPADANSAIENRSLGGVLSGSGETVLGNVLNNPYALDNINQAYQMLRGSTGNLQPTHYYLKWVPQTGEHIEALEAFEEAYGYEFETQPIHFEVVYEGTENYVDPAIGENGFSPEYGAITAAHFNASAMPAVPFELLEVMHIPQYETRLTFTAFVISGNEAYYEATEGLCHPDCPTWPDCLEDSSLTCEVVPGTALGTIALAGAGSAGTVTSTAPKANFPNYILDDRMGLYGEHEVINAIIPEPIECPPGCIAKLRLNPSAGPFHLEWYCDCDDDPTEDDDDDEEDPEPPTGQVEQCGCFVYENKKKPGGRIMLTDTQTGDEGVRRVKVKTTKHHWGFIWRNTDTDDEGCWKIDKAYNVRRMKTKVVFKDRASDRAVIRSFRGARFWNAFLKPVKYTWKLRRNGKNWHALCLRLEDDPEDHTSKQEEGYVAALTNNGMHEYYDDYGIDLPSPGKLRILIHTFEGNAAPMFHKLFQDGNIQFSVIAYISAVFGPPTISPGLAAYWELMKPDILIDFGDPDPSDDKRQTVYHEMVHASQYVQVGTQWWADYVTYTMTRGIANEPMPYGDGTAPGAGRAELAEGMAESVELYLADLKYGLLHSDGTPAQFFRYMNQAELLEFWEDPDLPPNANFIPEGLFFDLFDENGANPAAGIVTVGEGNRVNSTTLPIRDNAGGFTFLEQLNACGPFTENIEEFQDQLWQQSGPNGNTLANYNQLFQDYGF